MDPTTKATPSEPTQEIPPPPMRRRVRLVIELILLLILMGGMLALVSDKIRFERVISPSMEPTLMVGDTIMTDANAPCKRYDIICFKDPDQKSQDILVKRVMGMPGDTIVIQDGILYINGKEEYSTAITDNKMAWNNDKVRVPEDCLFVMGDNRNNSEDSRVFGPVPRKNITGVATLIVWPLKHWGRPKKIH